MSKNTEIAQRVIDCTVGAVQTFERAGLVPDETPPAAVYLACKTLWGGDTLVIREYDDGDCDVYCRRSKKGA